MPYLALVSCPKIADHAAYGRFLFCFCKYDTRFYGLAGTMTHTPGTLAYMFLFFWFPFVPLSASPLFLLVFC